MKAVVQERYGAPERVLRPAEIDPPAVGDDDVLVRVRATCVNTPDWITVAGVPYALRSAYYAGIIHARLGEAEAAMRCLERAAGERSGYVPFGLTNNYASLRETREFRALMERLGLQVLNAGTHGKSSSPRGRLTQDL